MVHSHAGHSHTRLSRGHWHGGHGSDSTDRRALTVVFGLTTAFLAAEVVGGLLTGSLALLADAGHMASDSASIGLALFAFWLSRRPATPNRSFGYRRAEILAALFNGMTLVAISIWIFVEAYRRFQEPPEVLGGWMLAVAALGLLVNLAGAAILARSGGESLNLQGALRHVIADILGSAGAIGASLVIILTGWVYADPLVSALIGVLVLASSWTLLRDSVNILLERAPRGLDVEEVGRKMVEVEGVEEVHDLHVWEITSGFPALAAHVLVGRDRDCHERRRDVELVLYREFGIEHTTLQVDHVGDHASEDAGRLAFLPNIERRDRGSASG